MFYIEIVFQKNLFIKFRSVVKKKKSHLVLKKVKRKMDVIVISVDVGCLYSRSLY